MGPRELLGWFPFESPLPLGSFCILEGRRKVVTSADQVHKRVLRLKSAFWEVETYPDLHIYYSASMRPRKPYAGSL